MTSSATTNESSTQHTALLKQLLTLAIPILIGGAVQTSYHLINAFWVGRLGTEGVAVITVTLPVNMLLISLSSGLSLAGSITIAQYFGAGNRLQINHVAAQTFTTMIVLALLLSILGYFAAPSILHGMRVTESIFPNALTYLRISFGSAIFLLLSSVYQAILRSVGEAKAPLRIIIASVILNSLLDPLLIFGWGPIASLGVIGAAYATVLTQIFSATAGIRLMQRPRFGLTLKLNDMWPNWSLIVRLIRLGLPSSLEQSMQALTTSVMTVFIAKFGTVAIAAYGLVFRILVFTIIPTFSISMATSILVGQSRGAGNDEGARRIAKVSAIFTFALMGFVGALLFFSANSIFAVFVPNDPRLVESGTLVLRIFSLSFPLSGMQMTLTGAFRGAGDTFTTMLLTLLGTWAIQMPLAFVLSRYTELGESGLWWSSTIAAVINTSITLLYFKSNRWMKARIVKSAVEQRNAA